MGKGGGRVNLEAEVWAIANRVCTLAELRALRKREDWYRVLDEQPAWSLLADDLGCSVRTARDRVSRAEDRIRREVAAR